MNTLQVDALAARTFHTPGLPKLDFGGDINHFAVPGENFPVIGDVKKGRYTNAGVPSANYRSDFGFTLMSMDEV
jgi:hypothetical protein